MRPSLVILIVALAGLFGGGVSQEDALAMIQAGATRIGASASVQIVQGDAKITESY